MQLLSASMSGMIKDNSIPKYMQVWRGGEEAGGGERMIKDNSIPKYMQVWRGGGRGKGWVCMW